MYREWLELEAKFSPCGSITDFFFLLLPSIFLSLYKDQEQAQNLLKHKSIVTIFQGKIVYELG